MAYQLGIPPRSMDRLLALLKDDFIIRVGARRGGHWELVSQIDMSEDANL